MLYSQPQCHLSFLFVDVYICLGVAAAAADSSVVDDEVDQL